MSEGTNGDWCSYRSHGLVYKWTRRLCPILMLFLVGYLAIAHRLSFQQPVLLQAGPLKQLFQISSSTRSGNLLINEENPFSASFLSSDTLPAYISTNLSTAPRAQQLEEKRVAVCLVGGARAFELTGPTIKKYVLDVYDKADVFLHAPLDKNSYKFHLLKEHKRLASSRIFKPDRLHETQLQKELLTSTGSPNGIQGLLQYFRLVEGCWDMITKHENEHKFKYQWIIRTRVDGYWSGPLPPLEHFTQGYYFVPYGSQFGGFNDRLGIGDRSTSQIALSRLSLLSSIHNQGYRKLNSESAFKAQLKSAKIKIKFERFSFCVLSFRKYDWPLNGVWDVPVASISSNGPLNGAKCRPCTPKLTGHDAKAVVESLQRSWSWIGPVHGLQLCDARKGWERNWENIFDKAAGREIALIRKNSSTQSNLNECIQQLSSFSEQWDVWDAPSPKTICTET